MQSKVPTVIFISNTVVFWIEIGYQSVDWIIFRQKWCLILQFIVYVVSWNLEVQFLTWMEFTFWIKNKHMFKRVCYIYYSEPENSVVVQGVVSRIKIYMAIVVFKGSIHAYWTYPWFIAVRAIDIQILVSMATDGIASAELILATTLPFHIKFSPW